VVTPSDSAPAVTLDAPIYVEYSPGYFGPDGPGEDPTTLIQLEACGACGTECFPGAPVTGLVQVHGDRLYFLPDEPLREGTQYQGHAGGLEIELDFGFCTGRSFDRSPPRLSGELHSSSTRVDAQCDLPDGGYRLAVSFAPATDDGPPGSIEYLLYLSRGAEIEAPRVVARARNYASEEITLGVLITPEDAHTPICLTLAATDGVGNAVVSDEPQCFDPITRTVFSGACTVARGASSGGAPAVVLSMGVLGLLIARRRR